MTLQTDIVCPVCTASLTVTTDFPQPEGASLDPHDPDAPEFSWACADGDLIGCPRCGLSGRVVEFGGADESEIAWDEEWLLGEVERLTDESEECPACDGGDIFVGITFPEDDGFIACDLCSGTGKRRTTAELLQMAGREEEARADAWTEEQRRKNAEAETTKAESRIIELEQELVDVTARLEKLTRLGVVEDEAPRFEWHGCDDLGQVFPGEFWAPCKGSTDIIHIYHYSAWFNGSFDGYQPTINLPLRGVTTVPIGPPVKEQPATLPVDVWRAAELLLLAMEIEPDTFRFPEGHGPAIETPQEEAGDD